MLPTKVDVVIATHEESHKDLYPYVAWGLLQNKENINKVFMVNDGPWEEYPLETFSEFEISFLDQAKKGFGLSRAINLGVFSCTADYVLIIEGDEILAPGSLKTNLQVCRPETVICGVKRYLKNDLQQLEKLITEKNPRIKFIEAKDHRSFRKLYQSYMYCSGGHLLVDRKAFCDLGGFHKQYEYGLHDFDLAVRWQLKYGDKIIYSPDLGQVWHIGSGRNRELPSEEAFIRFSKPLAKLMNHRYHLGCEVDRDVSCVNVDKLWYGDLALDCANIDWIEDSSANFIKHKHLLEHFPPQLAVEHLKQCFTKLVPGGELHIVVPDFKKCLDKFEEDPAQALLGIYGEQGALKQTDNVYQVHRWGWSEKMLCKTLQKIGFSIEYSGEDEEATFARWRDTRVEAMKPEA